jgi:cytidylate kinase
MRIITISRQFGSGGRELGKRLADRLGWDYYDKEILETLAEGQGLDKDYVRKVLANHGWHNVQLTYRNSFDHLMFNPGMRTQLLVRQREILQEIAAMGSDCIIVGRDADVILQDYRPFRIYACADMEERIRRCAVHEEKRPAELRLSEKEIARNIRRIDKNRARTREILTGKQHGDASAFDLTVNTASWDIKKLTDAVADFALRFFED